MHGVIIRVVSLRSNNMTQLRRKCERLEVMKDGQQDWEGLGILSQWAKCEDEYMYIPLFLRVEFNWFVKEEIVCAYDFVWWIEHRTTYSPL